MRMRKKQDLPTKLCVCCGLPFTWRKKWERDWASVKFCSDRCRQQGAAHGGSAQADPTEKPFKYIA
jgi:hypothetical protein